MRIFIHSEKTWKTEEKSRNGSGEVLYPVYRITEKYRNETEEILFSTKRMYVSGRICRIIFGIIM